MEDTAPGAPDEGDPRSGSVRAPHQHEAVGAKESAPAASRSGTILQHDVPVNAVVSGV
jgi:hypothetical protein